MVNSYFFAPDFSTQPPPNGPIHLGSILRGLTEFYPINRTVQPIPETDLFPVDKKNGFKISLHELHSAEFGFGARFLELIGVSARASIERTKGKSNVLSCQCLETIAFIPTDRYIEEGMKHPTVAQFMRSDTTRAPLYMVTGLKIARGESSTSTTTNQALAIETNVGLGPAGTPLEIGGEAGFSRGTEEGQSFSASDNDYIVSFRVRKIWRDRKGRVHHEPHIEKAVMLSADTSSDESDDDEGAIRWDDDLTLEEINDMFGMGEDDI